jgi:two-component system, OmpR family, response regulator ResD
MKAGTETRCDVESARNTVLVVEDDASITELLDLYLSRQGYEVLTTAEGGAALDLVGDHKPALVVLDLMLPDQSGFQVLKALRTFSQVPVIILTAKDADQDKILGLELGADDYMTKPFSPGELVARVRAVLRRSAPAVGEDRLAAGEVELLPEKREVWVEGQAVELTPKEFELLQYLLLNRGIALSRERLLEEVWGYSFYGDSRTVDAHIRQLRKKLTRWGSLIHTVWGVGYKLDPKSEPGMVE